MKKVMQLALKSGAKGIKVQVAGRLAALNLFKIPAQLYPVEAMMGMNPRQMKKLMKQLGIKMEELEGVEEVIIRMKGKEVILKDPAVTVITAQGEKTYQIVPGSEEVREVLEIPEEDIRLVMEQARVDYDTAKKALEEAKGDLAEAIIKLTEE
jgi:nascent polypeptide-associated complex subunit alpha